MKKVSTTIRNPNHATDHVSAEENRREKLAQHFISLSALLPKSTKTDMASVLEDACNYIKQLKGHVKELEESTICVKKSGHHDDACFSDETKCEDIKVKMSGNSLLVKIICPKKAASFVNVLGEMLKMGVSVVSTNAMPFNNTALFINITAEMEDDFCMTPTDILRNLQGVL